MTLQGTLDTFALTDVLRFLASTANTGCLTVEGDRRAGRVWLEGGSIVAAEVDAAAAPDAEVVFALLRNREGGFGFGADGSAPLVHAPGLVEEVIAEAEARLVSWQAIESVVSSLDLRVTLAPDQAGDTSVTPEQWRWLVAVGEGRTVAELATAMELDEIAVSTMVKSLHDIGLVEIGTDLPPPGGSTDVALDQGPDAGSVADHAYLTSDGAGAPLPEPLPALAGADVLRNGQTTGT